MSKPVRYRMCLKVTMPRIIRVFGRLAAVVCPQGRIFSRAWERNDTAASADLTAKGAVLLFFSRALAVVCGVGCDDRLDDDELDNGEKTPDFGAGLGAMQECVLGCRVGVGTYGDLPAYVGVGAYVGAYVGGRRRLPT
jgi:hypothetical protein